MNKSHEIKTFQLGENEFNFPIGTIEGKEPGPVVCIAAGIHGCEYPGIASAMQLYQQLKPEDIKGTVKIITIANVPGFEERAMFVCPKDNLNPNRVYPGKKVGSYTEQMVYLELEEFVKTSDYFIDLHGGDMVEALEPFSIIHKSGKKDIDQKSIELAEAFGLPNIITTTTNGGMSYSNGSEAGIPSIIAEVGGIGQLYQKDTDQHLEGLYNVLKYAGCINEKPKIFSDLTYYKQYIWVKTEKSGFFFGVKQVGDTVNKEEELGKLTDYFGNPTETVYAPVSGKILFLTTSPAMKEQGLLMGIGVNES